MNYKEIQKELTLLDNNLRYKKALEEVDGVHSISVTTMTRRNDRIDTRVGSGKMEEDILSALKKEIIRIDETLNEIADRLNMNLEDLIKDLD